MIPDNVARNSRRTVIVAVIVAILVILVVAATILLLPSGGLTMAHCPGTDSCLYQIRGTISVTQSGAGTIALTIDNQANYPFTQIALKTASPALGDLTPSAPFLYNGTEISASSPLQIGDSSNGACNFSSGGVVSEAYSVSVTVTMTNGQLVTENVSIVASASS